MVKLGPKLNWFGGQAVQVAISNSRVPASGTSGAENLQRARLARYHRVLMDDLLRDLNEAIAA